jgi:cell division ATPase FtsA
LRRIHRIQTGGSHITNAIAKELQCTFGEAENIKRQYTAIGENDVRISKMFENAYAPVFAEFNRVINQYEQRTQKGISRTVITGGGALFPQAITIAQYALGKTIERSNPFNKITYPAFLEDTLIHITPSFTVALGAALRQFEQ